MSSPTARRRAASLCTLALVGMLTACGNNNEPAASPGDDGSSKTPSATPSQTPTGTPTGTATPTPTPTAGTPQGPAGRLLAAAEVPGLNEKWKWADGATGAATQDAFGLCQKFDLVSIGAESAVQRTFNPGPELGDATGASAGEQIATFPDAMTAQRANKVLVAWHDKCRAQVKATVKGAGRVSVRPMTDVPVSAGKGSWYLVSYPKGANSDDGHFHATGIVVSGTTIALLRMDNDGQDYNYARGSEPMVSAVKAAAQKLG